MTSTIPRVLSIALVTLVVAAAMPWRVAAQPTAPPEPPPAAEEQPTGLPSAVKWKFNLDAGWGTFGFGNSLFLNPKDPGTNENLSDQWFEGYVKPALSGTYTLANSSAFYGKVSAVGERTYGSVPSQFGEDVSSFGPEDLNIGWRSGKSIEIQDTEDVLDFTVGRSRYRLGHGFLLYDGAAEGGSRGGYWTNARQAFELATIARFKAGRHKVEAFYLDKDERPENDSGSRVAGANYEITLAKTTTLGFTQMRWWADPAKKPGRDGLEVFNARAYTAPIPGVPDLSFEFEYAAERNGDALDSNAWTLQGAYEFSKTRWKPKLTYRYAFFEGDDPDTSKNEAFDSLFLGFYDWGTWWQGEIAGEYFLSNSNLASNLFRVHVSPTDTIGTGLLLFNFKLDQPRSAGPTVTDKDAAFEIDWYTDWKFNKNFTVSVLAAYADPGKAVQQLTGRTKNFAYGMVYVAYSF
jgi:Alginate export